MEVQEAAHKCQMRDNVVKLFKYLKSYRHLNSFISLIVRRGKFEVVFKFVLKNCKLFVHRKTFKHKCLAFAQH